MIEKSRQVQPIAQLNAQVIDIFSAREIERGHAWVPCVQYWRLGWMVFHDEEPLIKIYLESCGDEAIS